MIWYVPQTNSVQVQTHSPFVPFVSQIVNITYYSFSLYDSSTFRAPTLYTITTLRFATARRSYGSRKQKSLPATSPAWFRVHNPTVGFFQRIFPKDFSNSVFKMAATAKALCCRIVDNVKMLGFIPLFLLSFIPVSILFYFHSHLVLLIARTKDLMQ